MQQKPKPMSARAPKFSSRRASLQLETFADTFARALCVCLLALAHSGPGAAGKQPCSLEAKLSNRSMGVPREVVAWHGTAWHGCGRERSKPGLSRAGSS